MFYKDMPEEVWTCIKWLYADAFIYMILAAYLNEVIPQEFGVPRHPLFFLETRIKSWSPSLHDAIFGDEQNLKAFKDDSELYQEDPDAKQERLEV